MSAPTTARSPGILLSTMLMNERETDVMSLGDLVFKCTMIEHEIEVLRAEMWAQGGIISGTHWFSSEDNLMSLIMSLHPRGNGLAAFSDDSSLFYHNEELGVSTDWLPVALTGIICCHLGRDTPKICGNFRIARGGGQFVCACNQRQSGGDSVLWLVNTRR